MKLTCNQPPKVPPVNPKTPRVTEVVESIEIDVELVGGESRDSGVHAAENCADAFDMAWEKWLTDPIITPEMAYSAGLAITSWVDGLNVGVELGSLSTAYTLDFSAAVAKYNWDQVVNLSLILPWSDADFLAPWLLEAHFGGLVTELVPGDEEVSLPLPFYHPGIALLEILPGIQTPELPCPPPYQKIDDCDGVTYAELNMKAVLSDTGNTSPTPDPPPFNVNLIGTSGGTSIVCPLVNVSTGP